MEVGIKQAVEAHPCVWIIAVFEDLCEGFHLRIGIVGIGKRYRLHQCGFLGGAVLVLAMVSENAVL